MASTDAVIHSGANRKDIEKALDFLNPETGEHRIPKYETFCLNYTQYFDKERSMLAAGFPADKTKKQLINAFSRVMKRKDIQLRIQSLIRAKALEAGVGPDWVVMKWMELYERCTQGVPILDRNGDATGEWRFEARSANDILESMAKYYGMFVKGEKAARPVQVNVNFGGNPPPKKVAFDGNSVDISE